MYPYEQLVILNLSCSLLNSVAKYTLHAGEPFEGLFG